MKDWMGFSLQCVPVFVSHGLPCRAGPMAMAPQAWERVQTAESDAVGVGVRTGTDPPTPQELQMMLALSSDSEKHQLRKRELWNQRAWVPFLISCLTLGKSLYPHLTVPYKTPH